MCICWLCIVILVGASSAGICLFMDSFNSSLQAMSLTVSSLQGCAKNEFGLSGADKSDLILRYQTTIQAGCACQPG